MGGKETVFCDVCGDDITGDYFPGVARCDNCTDLHGLEEPMTHAEYFEGPVSDPGDIFETDTLGDVLRDIARGL